MDILIHVCINALCINPWINSYGCINSYEAQCKQKQSIYMTIHSILLSPIKGKYYGTYLLYYELYL